MYNDRVNGSSSNFSFSFCSSWFNAAILLNNEYLSWFTRHGRKLMIFLQFRSAGNRQRMCHYFLNDFNARKRFSIRRFTCHSRAAALTFSWKCLMTTKYQRNIFSILLVLFYELPGNLELTVSHSKCIGSFENVLIHYLSKIKALWEWIFDEIASKITKILFIVSLFP